MRITFSTRPVKQEPTIQIRYLRDGQPYGRNIPSPLLAGESFSVGKAKLERALLAAKIGLSQVISVRANHKHGAEACAAIERRGHAQRQAFDKVVIDAKGESDRARAAFYA